MGVKIIWHRRGLVVLAVALLLGGVLVHALVVWLNLSGWRANMLGVVIAVFVALVSDVVHPAFTLTR